MRAGLAFVAVKPFAFGFHEDSRDPDGGARAALLGGSIRSFVHMSDFAVTAPENCHEDG